MISHFLRFSFIVLCLLGTQAFAASDKTIGISQFVSHPSLDKVHKGVLAGLLDAGYEPGKNLRIIDQNAAGNVAMAVQIAKTFAAERVDAVVAIATPSAQAAVSATSAHSIPVIFASISDPVGAKLVQSLAHPGKLATGTRNVLPFKEQLQLVHTLLPQAKRLGVLANLGEVNTVSMLETLKQVNAARAHPYEIAVQSVTNSAQVSSAAQELAGRSDVLFLVQDNTVATALPAIAKIAQGRKIPIIAGFDDAVEQGALASIAPDEYRIGYQTGQMAAHVLAGASVATMAVQDSLDYTTRVNKEVAKALGIKVPASLQTQ